MQTYPFSYTYEILVRGLPDGKFGGAHIIRNTVYAPGVESTGSAEPLPLTGISGVIDAAFASLADDLREAKAKIAALTDVPEAAVSADIPAP